MAAVRVVRSGILGPLIGEGRPAPREVEVAPPEMAVRGDLPVDGPAQSRALMIPKGDRSMYSSISEAIMSLGTFSVPNVSTSTETGLATPIA